MNDIAIDNEKLETATKALSDGIEESFNWAFKRLGEITREAAKTYAEHKDEIDAEVEKRRLEQERLQSTMPKILIGDIIRINSIHCRELKCYEVSDKRIDGVISQPAGFHHNYNEIIAIYRFDGMDFKCIWEREDYKGI